VGDADPHAGRPGHHQHPRGGRARPRPVADPQYNPRLPAVGVTNKTIFDCTAPFHLRDEFVRAPFQDLDPTPWL
jgi:hypothetical protein